MPSAADIQAYVVNALQQQRPDLARPWRDTLLKASDDPASLTLLGRLAAAEGDFVAALTYTGEAIRLQPYHTEAYYLRARLLGSAGAYDEAIRHCQAILGAEPLHDEALLELYNFAQSAQRPDIAAEALQRRLRRGPNSAEFRNLLGLMLHATGDIEGALAAYDDAIAQAPEMPLYYNNRATILYHLERYQDALKALDHSLKLLPDYAVAWHNVGNVYKATKRLNLAERAYRRAINLSPEYPEPHFNLGCILLQQNRWQEGWAEYEWRWNIPGLVAPIHCEIPKWHGEPLAGRRLMVVAEQGSGDTLQFLRYVKYLAETGVEIVAWAPVETAALLERQPYIRAASNIRSVLPPADLYVPMLSLPRLLNLGPTSLPGTPYLNVDLRKAMLFLRELGPRQEQLRIGISWAGNPKQVDDRHRSTTLSALQPLFDLHSIRWISLQKGPRVADLGQQRTPIEDWSKRLNSFDDTAALVAALDGVVSVCSAPLHVAGAMGQQAAGILTWAADWRWGEDTTKTSWYDSVTLLRQPNLNDWHDVVTRAAQLVSSWKPRGLMRNLS